MKYKQALEFARHNRKNQTPAEVFFWGKVRNRKFCGKKILRQFIIEYQANLGERNFYIVDFYCSEKNLVVELDGGIHLHQKKLDKARQTVLENMKLKVIRFTNEEVLKNWDAVSLKLKNYLLL